MSVLIVTWRGFTEPLASPDQLPKVFAPVPAAVSVTTVPLVYLPPVQFDAGLGVTAPVPTGTTVVVSV